MYLLGTCTDKYSTPTQLHLAGLPNKAKNWINKLFGGSFLKKKNENFCTQCNKKYAIFRSLDVRSFV